MKIRMLTIFAVIMLVISVNVAAETNVTSQDGVGNVSVGEKPSNQTEILAVNPGDTITIGITGAADKITLVSYKGSTVSADSMQYINQYPQDTTAISYKIREIDNTQNGLYLLLINDGNNVSSFYYKVGRPVLETDEGVNYFKRVDFGSGEGRVATREDFMNTTSLAYLASFTPAGGVVSSFGFNVKNLSSDKSVVVDVDDTADISGEAVFQYGITIYNIPSEDTTALQDYIDNLLVVPYVNYQDTDTVDA